MLFASAVGYDDGGEHLAVKTASQAFEHVLFLGGNVTDCFGVFGAEAIDVDLHGLLFLLGEFLDLFEALLLGENILLDLATLCLIVVNLGHQGQYGVFEF